MDSHLFSQQPVADQLQFAAVFGSVASNKATATSDIDLLLVGDLSFAAAVKQLYPAQQQLGREINPKLYSLAEWPKALAAPFGFMTELLVNPLLMIAGDKDDLVPKQPEDSCSELLLQSSFSTIQQLPADGAKSS